MINNGCDECAYIVYLDRECLSKDSYICLQGFEKDK